MKTSDLFACICSIQEYFVTATLGLGQGPDNVDLTSTQFSSVGLCNSTREGVYFIFGEKIVQICQTFSAHIICHASCIEHSIQFVARLNLIDENYLVANDQGPRYACDDHRDDRPTLDILLELLPAVAAKICAYNNII